MAPKTKTPKTKTPKRKPQTPKRNSSSSSSSSETAYCVRCRDKRTMVHVDGGMTKNGQPMRTGNCSTCQSKMCKFVKKD